MLKYVANILVYLSLAVWIGSLIFFGVGVAAVLFKQGMLPSRTLAGAVNSAILSRLGMFEVACGVVLVGGTFYAAFRYGQWVNWGAFLLSVSMLCAALYYTNVLFPRVDALRASIGNFDSVPAEKAELKQQFDEGHQRYSTLARGVLLGGVLVLVLHTVGLIRHFESKRGRELPTSAATPSAVPHAVPPSVAPASATPPRPAVEANPPSTGTAPAPGDIPVAATAPPPASSDGATAGS